MKKSNLKSPKSNKMFTLIEFLRMIFGFGLFWLSLSLPAAENKIVGTEDVLRFPPAVFAVEDEYQIMVIASDTLVRIRVGDQFYSDHVNGVRPSRKTVHRFRIPMDVLDKAGKYEIF